MSKPDTGLERYLRDTTLAEIYDVDRSTIWRWSRNGTLPPPVKLSAGVSRWLASSIRNHRGAA